MHSGGLDMRGRPSEEHGYITPQMRSLDGELGSVRPQMSSIATSGRPAQLTYVDSLVVEAAAGGTALSVSASATPCRVRRWSASK